MVQQVAVLNYQTPVSNIDAHFEEAHQQKYWKQGAMADPIAYMTGSKPEEKGTIYYHKAMKQEDSGEFVEAIIKETKDHIVNKH